jgi:tryptophan synthase alpha chain
VCTRAAKEAGVDGFIVPDVPPEEATALDAICRAQDLDLIFLAVPTSAAERLRKIADATRGFLYLASVTGVTGARDQVAADLGEFVGRVRSIKSKPVCVGFGIASTESARTIAGLADSVIVGSALVARIGDNGNATEAARAFLAELRAAIDA